MIRYVCHTPFVAGELGERVEINVGDWTTEVPDEGRFDSFTPVGDDERDLDYVVCRQRFATGEGCYRIELEPGTRVDADSELVADHRSKFVDVVLDEDAPRRRRRRSRAVK